MKLPKFFIYSWIVLGWNLLVILWGAYVRATGSGAGCGRHWPLCNGQVVPQNPGAAMTVEFTHRLLSGGAIVLIAALVVWGFRVSSRGHPVRKSLVAAGILIFVEALLGAGLVLFELVAENTSAIRAVAVALHLANTFLLVASLALTAYWASGGAPFNIPANRRTALLNGLGLLGILFIGMSGAITALGDTLFPPSTLAEGFAQDIRPGAHFLIELRVYHPVIAILVAIYTLYLVRSLYNRNWGFSRKMLVTLFIVGGAQILVGVTNLLTLAPIPLQLFHLFMADMVWIFYILTTAVLLGVPQSLKIRLAEVE